MQFPGQLKMKLYYRVTNRVGGGGESGQINLYLKILKIMCGNKKI